MKRISNYNTYRKSLQLPDKINFRFLKFKRQKWQKLKLRIVREKKLRYRILKLLVKVRIVKGRRRPRFKKLKIYLRSSKFLIDNLNKKSYNLKWNKRPVLEYFVLKKERKDFLLKLKKFKQLKKKLENTLKKSKRINNLFIFCKKFDSIRKYHKNCLGSKHSFNCFFDGAISNTQAFRLFISNRKKSFIISFLKCLIKPILRLDILLWTLNFSISVSQATEFIRKRLVKVNKKVVNYKFFLKKGDIITFSDFFNKNVFRKSILKYSKSSVLLNFFEIDYYTNTIIIIKDLEVLTSSDVTLLLSFYYDIKRLKYYLSK